MTYNTIHTHINAVHILSMQHPKMILYRSLSCILDNKRMRIHTHMHTHTHRRTHTVCKYLELWLLKFVNVAVTEIMHIGNKTQDVSLFVNNTSHNKAYYPLRWPSNGSYTCYHAATQGGHLIPQDLYIM